MSVLSHSLSCCETHLVLRLYSEGRVEWEDEGTMRVCKQSGKDKSNGLHSTRTSVERVAAMRRSIDNLDLESVKGKLGPYNRYVDTNVEFFIKCQCLKRDGQIPRHQSLDALSRQAPSRRPESSGL